MHATVKQLENRDFYVTAWVGPLARRDRHADVGQLRPSARLPPRRRGDAQRARQSPSSRRSAPATVSRASQPSERRLKPGERLILLTDGITDRPLAGEGTFGIDGVKRALQGAASPTAAGSAMAIQQAVTDCSREPFQDDATVVVMAVA